MLKINEKFNLEKFRPSNLYISYKVTKDTNYIIAKWSESKKTSKNFGDALNPWLFEKLTGNKPINVKHIINIGNKPVYSMIGSILDNNRVKNLVVWGSGFKYKNALLKTPPKNVCAVRGPLSRENLRRQGINCPEVYGDPALLLPRVYNPKIDKKYKLGIIPHYVDKVNSNLKRLCMEKDSNTIIIDIESGIEKVIDEILSCELIASSSLHGLIVADAYNIPSLYIKFSDKIAGGNFKFRDYMLSVGKIDTEPLDITDSVSIDNIIAKFINYKINIDIDKLLEVCPFNHKL